MGHVPLKTQPEPILGFIDCSFYASYERVFRPDLAECPSWFEQQRLLSHRSKLRRQKSCQKMDAQHHQIKHFLRQKGIMAFCSNYAFLVV